MQSAHLARTQLWIVAFAIVYWLLSLLTVEYLHRSYLRDYLAEQQQWFSQKLSLIRANIEAKVNADILLADSLATILSFNPDVPFSKWNLLAGQLADKGEYIRSISIAPNDVVALVYPLAGNESVMGLDFRETPAQMPAVLEARMSRQITLDGPISLIQGGIGLVARAPVFADPPTNTQYWGVCSIVIDLDRLINSIRDAELTDGMTLGIRTLQYPNTRGPVFVGQNGDFDNARAVAQVHLLGANWEIALAEPAELRSWGATNAVRLIGYGVALFLFLSFLMVSNAYRMARQVSLQDALTGLPNRRFAMSLLNKLIQTPNGRFTVVNVDLNYFKQVNDNFGHAAGDAMLKAVATRMQSGLRNSDMVARLGGDEFLLILPRLTSAADISQVLMKVRHAACEQPLHMVDITLNISISMGAARYPEDGQDITELLHVADKAMYEDKQRIKGER
ncbi:diguanylate cyclase domain-containing protein [Shewanella sp. FJAT-52076]|uniref:diguanylate cyclase domain-containing protein n=1 Tax=Shewanella sp. FJAT-52076 TaxID=2864202 RepID=UPI001C6604F5|nr:diguanylate cyclase [Shewanella sp. FJAT-52076]QYJ75163.1 sensor domain-containing diguanylate cyclase [Shewanella sp. FJAT-52076]